MAFVFCVDIPEEKVGKEKCFMILMRFFKSCVFFFFDFLILLQHEYLCVHHLCFFFYIMFDYLVRKFKVWWFFVSRKHFLMCRFDTDLYENIGDIYCVYNYGIFFDSGGEV